MTSTNDIDNTIGPDEQPENAPRPDPEAASETPMDFSQQTHQSDLTDPADLPDTTIPERDEPDEQSTSDITGQLFLVGTPIGNADDITIRARRTLEYADVIVTEDYKVAARLLRGFNITKKLIELTEENAAEKSGEVIAMIRDGKKVAVLADPGLSLLADPESALMKGARAAGIEPKVIPGISAVMTALLASGFSMERFEFVGFLPRTLQERTKAAAALATHTGTIAILETQARLRSLLTALADAMPDRRAAVAVNLTMGSEAIIRGSLSEIDERMKQRRVRGELVLVLDHYNAPPPGTAREARSSRERQEERSEPRESQSAYRTATPRTGGAGKSSFRREGPHRQMGRPSGFRRDDERGRGERGSFGERGFNRGGRDERSPGRFPRRDEGGSPGSDRRRDDRSRGGFGGGSGRGQGDDRRRDDRSRGGFGSGTGRGQRDDRRRDDRTRGGFGGGRGQGDDRHRDDRSRSGFGGGAGRGQGGDRRRDGGTGYNRRKDEGRGEGPRRTFGRDASGFNPPRRKPDQGKGTDRRRRNDDNEGGVE